MAGSSSSSYVKDDQGCTFIPASQRPDGTWRKSRRVKDGYVPQEEVPLYESKGKQFVKSKPVYPPGYTPDVKEPKSKKASSAPVPGMAANSPTEVAKTNKRKKKKKGHQSASTDGGKQQAPPSAEGSKQQKGASSSSAPAPAKVETSAVTPDKRLKNLRKKLREIEAIQERISSGTLKNPERDQLDKLSRKSQVENEIQTLMETLNLV